MEILVYYFLELKGTECDPHQWNCSLISSGISKISETRDYKHYRVTAPFLGFPLALGFGLSSLDPPLGWEAAPD